MRAGRDKRLGIDFLLAAGKLLISAIAARIAKLHPFQSQVEKETHCDCFLLDNERDFLLCF